MDGNSSEYVKIEVAGSGESEQYEVDPEMMVLLGIQIVKFILDTWQHWRHRKVEKAVSSEIIESISEEADTTRKKMKKIKTSTAYIKTSGPSGTEGVIVSDESVPSGLSFQYNRMPKSIINTSQEDAESGLIPNKNR